MSNALTVQVPSMVITAGQVLPVDCGPDLADSIRQIDRLYGLLSVSRTRGTGQTYEQSVTEFIFWA